jgi:hypothetical protein
MAPVSGGFVGGDEGARTLDLRLAKPALSQLSYVPVRGRVYNARHAPAMRPLVASRLTTPHGVRPAGAMGAATHN